MVAAQFDFKNTPCILKGAERNALYKTCNVRAKFCTGARIWSGHFSLFAEEARPGSNGSEQNRAMFLPDCLYEVTR